MNQTVFYSHSPRKSSHSPHHVRFIRDGKVLFDMFFSSKSKADDLITAWERGATQGELAVLDRNWGG